MKPVLMLCLLTASAVNAVCQQGAPQSSNGGSAVSTASEVPQRKISAEKEAKIRKLLTLSGVQELAQTSMAGTEKSMRPLLASSLPPGEYRERLIDLFLERFHQKATIDKLVELVIPAYDKYFSDEELTAVLAFYQTPIGRKTLSVTPKIVAEVQDKGREWGSEMGKQSMAEVLEEHPDLKSALNEAAQKAARPAQ